MKKIEKVHATVARRTCPSQNVQSTPFLDHFWKLRCSKSARRCGAKQTILGPLSAAEMFKKWTLLWREAQSKPFLDHFWKLRCSKRGRFCGEKHISKSNCTKHTIVRPLLEVEMFKKCTPLWREAHVQVKMYKARHSQTTLASCDVEKVYIVVARSTFPSQKCKS